MMSKILICFLLYILSFSVFACVAPKSDVFVSPLDLVKKSSVIVLGKAMRAEVDGGSNRFQIKSIEVLKGNSQDFFEILVPNAIPGNINMMGLHESVSFWVDNKVGGMGVYPDCSLRPNFQVGHSYLIFYSQKPTVKSYELIVSNNDKWYSFVKDILSEESNSPIFSKLDFINSFNSIHLYQCSLKKKKKHMYSKLKKTYRGLSPVNSPRPDVEFFNCRGEGEQFLYMSNNENLALIVPVRKGIVYIESVSKGVELVRDNSFSLNLLED